jgi:hypothetical protein
VFGMAQTAGGCPGTRLNGLLVLLPGFSEMDVHVDKTRTDNFPGCIDRSRFAIRDPRFGLLDCSLSDPGDFNNFIMLNKDVSHRVQIAGVDDSAALNLYSQWKILQLSVSKFLSILKFGRADPI